MRVFSKVRSEECGDLAKCLFALRHGIILHVVRVRSTLKHLEHGFYTRTSQLAVDTDCIAQKQVPSARSEYGRRETVHVAVYG